MNQLIKLTNNLILSKWEISLTRLTCIRFWDKHPDKSYLPAIIIDLNSPNVIYNVKYFDELIKYKDIFPQVITNNSLIQVQSEIDNKLNRLAKLNIYS